MQLRTVVGATETKDSLVNAPELYFTDRRPPIESKTFGALSVAVLDVPRPSRIRASLLLSLDLPCLVRTGSSALEFLG